MMKVFNFYESDNKEYWLNEIGKSDWSAGKALFEYLRDDKLKGLIGDNARVMLLADDNNKLISFCTYAELDEIQPTDLTPWIGFAYTFPEYRGNRYLGILFDEIEKLANEEGYTNMHISTDAVGLYEKYGYEFYQMMRSVYDEDCRIYIKKLVKE